jgi:hypothetical protein
MRLEGKVIITGSTTGIGSYGGLRFRRRKVIIHGLEKDS